MVHNFKEFSPDSIGRSAMDETVTLAKQLDEERFTDMTFNYINDLLNIYNNPLEDEELLELTKFEAEEDREEVTNEKCENSGLTLECVTTLHRKAKELRQYAENWDPNMISFLKCYDSIFSDV